MARPVENLRQRIKLTLAVKTFEGICEDVADDGAIMVRTSTGLKSFTAGEVTLLQ